MKINTRTLLITIGVTTLVTAQGLLAALFSICGNITDRVSNDISMAANITSKLVSDRLALLKTESQNTAELLIHSPGNIVAPEKASSIMQKATMQHQLLSMALLDAHYKIAAAHGNILPDGSYDDDPLAQRAYNGETVISSPQTGKNGIPVIRIFTPVNKNILISTLPGLSMNDLVTEFSTPKYGNIFILDSVGMLVAAPNPENVLQHHNPVEMAKNRHQYKNSRDFFEHLLQRETGIGSYSYNEKKYIAAFAPIPGTDGWSVVISVPADEISISPTGEKLLILGIILTAFSSAAAFLAAGIVSRQIGTQHIQQTPATPPPVSKIVSEPIKEENGNGSDSPTAPRCAGQQRLKRIPMPNAKVLVADDIQTNLDIAKGILKPYGMQVDCCASGIEAIEIIRKAETKYDALFMDHMMPKMDGIEATRIIREEIGTDYAKNIPIIALTANSASSNEQTFLEKGFQALLSKPIDIRKLDEILRKWIPVSENNNGLAQTGEQNSPQNPGLPNEKIISTITEIDWQTGLNRFGGDWEGYLSIIRSYIDSTTHLIGKILNVAPETLPDYAITVHGIKGSSFGIEANNTGKKAEELEHAAKAGDFTFISQNNPIFIEHTQQLLTRLSELIKASIKETEKKKSRYAPDQILLNNMAEAAANFKIDDLETAMNALEKFKYETQEELIVWLREQVNQMQFNAIHQRLTHQDESKDTA
ncbi:MAG: response regulator [Azoarcus sp.]|nr:response regulator [Azoarcus sp.]